MAPRKPKTQELPTESKGVDSKFMMEVCFMMVACCLILLTVIFVRTIFFAPVCTNGPLLLQTVPPGKESTVKETKGKAHYLSPSTQPGPIVQPR